MTGEIASITALWGAVILSGVYHGLNPGMGWPLAVSSALMAGKKKALAPALGALAFGHLLAMAAILLPFSLLTFLVTWELELRLGASLLLIGLGLFLFIVNRHPRFLARIPPSRLALWSFLIAMAHGAGLMIVPIYLGLCKVAELDAGHQAAAALMSTNVFMAFMVALAHTAAMTVAGAALAVGVYFWLGLKFLSQSWFNLDRVWAASLVLVGAISLYAALQGPHI